MQTEITPQAVRQTPPRTKAPGKRGGRFSRRAWRPWVALLLIAASAGLLGAEPSRGQDALVQLFLDPAAPLPAAPPFSQVRLARLNPAVAEQLQAPAALAPLRLTLRLCDGEEDVLRIERRESPGPGRVVCRGRVEGEPGSFVTLALCRGAVAGSVFLPGRGSFQIQDAGAGWQRIGKIDGGSIPPCAASGRSGSTSSSAAAPPGTGSFALPAPPPETNAILDLLVVYTRAARLGAGGAEGMSALIDLAVAEANQAFENSLVSARLQLVHQAEVDYEETGDINQDLDNLEEDDEEDEPDEGPIVGVHELRRQYRADLVCLITETTGGPLGLANIMHDVKTDFSEKAFSVVQRQFANTYYVLAHEIGHNLGCQHDRATSSGDGAFEYSHAHRFMAGGLHYHTIMAYEPGLPTPHFSNPNALFLGVPTGVPAGSTNSADNARTLNRTAETAAQFSTVLRQGTPPTITLLAPASGDSFFAGQGIEFATSPADADGQIVKVEFFVNDLRTGEIKAPPFNLLWESATPGSYSIVAVAKDDAGWRTMTAPITIFVVPAPPAMDPAGTFFLPDGSFQVRAQGEAGQGFRIDSSTDLTTWSPLFTNRFTGRFFEVIDSQASMTSARFYRVLPAP